MGVVVNLIFFDGGSEATLLPEFVSLMVMRMHEVDRCGRDTQGKDRNKVVVVQLVCETESEGVRIELSTHAKYE